MIHPARAAAIGILTLGTSIWMAGCRKPPNAYVAPPPPEVTVANPVQQTIDDTLEFTGVTRAIETVEIRARVKGFILKRFVEGGQRVKAGDLLLTIDPRPFQATVNQAKAEVAVREAALKLSEITLARIVQAADRDAVSRLEADRATADRDAAKAQVDLANAQLEQAQLDLGYSEIRAPISGRLGIKTLDVGQLVGANESTLLFTLINDEKIYASYNMPEKVVLGLRKTNENRRPGEDGRPNIKVMMALANDLDYPHVGEFHKADNTADAATGTVGIEAIFDNPKGTILPGLFVRLKPILGEKQAMLVPDIAVLSDQTGRYVLVVDKDDKVVVRYVNVGTVINRMRVLVPNSAGDFGLKTDDRVIVNGIQRARPGIQVKPVMQAPPTATAGSPSGGSEKAAPK